MNKEIDDFIEKNMNEMNKGIEELRVSYEDEINCIDGNIINVYTLIEDVFPDVVRGMKEDMEVELENLKEQYDEHRNEGVEKIKSKYNIKK